MEIMKRLLNSHSVNGRVDWIGFANAPRGPVVSQSSATLIQGSGVKGDHHCRPGRGSKRQVTLIQAEHLSVVMTLLDGIDVSPEQLRRNIVVSGINLASLRHQRFRIGTATLRGSGGCPPCSRMEENLGVGGYAAMLGHGGITAIVEESGTFSLGDAVEPLGYTGLAGVEDEDC